MWSFFAPHSCCSPLPPPAAVACCATVAGFYRMKLRNPTERLPSTWWLLLGLTVSFHVICIWKIICGEYSCRHCGGCYQRLKVRKRCRFHSSLALHGYLFPLLLCFLQVLWFPPKSKKLFVTVLVRLYTTRYTLQKTPIYTATPFLLSLNSGKKFNITGEL